MQLLENQSLPTVLGLVTSEAPQAYWRQFIAFMNFLHCCD